MKVTYTPEDAPQDKRTWHWNTRKVRQSEAAIIERQYGKPWAQFVAEAQGGSIRALRVLVWHLMRVQDGHSALRFDDVPDFYVGEVETAHSADELREGMRNLESAAGLDPAEREYALSVARAQLAIAEADESREVAEVEPGK